MSITGNILIDKLRINIPIPTLNELKIDTNEYKQKVRDILDKHFMSKNAFSVCTAYNYVKITLTPTRFKPKADGYFTDTNLEMPSEKWLLNLFMKLGFDKNRRICESANITWIHLTKNIITDNVPLDYITFLANFPLKRRFISSLISSNGRNTTLRLSTPKRDTTKKDIIGDRTFIFYDKTQELQNKANKGFITPKHKLTDKEIKYISEHGGWYVEQGNYLNISGLNLLRCELQYRYKDKILPLQNFLNPMSKQDSLTIATVIDLLHKKELYTRFDEFYTKELQEIVFYSLPNEPKEHLTSYKKAFADLLDDSDMITLELLYDSLDLGKIFRKNKAELQRSNKDIYTELYNKFILCQNN